MPVEKSLFYRALTIDEKEPLAICPLKITSITQL
jgi:hypothetical protein